MEIDYNEFTVEELQDELRERGLKVSGNKEELVDRLERFEDDGVEPEPKDDSEEVEFPDESDEEPVEETTEEPTVVNGSATVSRTQQESDVPRGQRGVTTGYHAHYLRSDSAIKARADRVDGDTELVLIGRVGTWIDQETDTKFVKGQPRVVDEDTAKRLLGETDSHGNPRFKFADS